MDSTESDPLISPASQAHASVSSQRVNTAFPTVYYIFPVAFLSRLAIVLPTTTFIELVLQVVCRAYWRGHDPDSIPIDGSMPPSMCAHPMVQQTFALTTTILNVRNGVSAFIMYGVINYLSGRIGRKPTFLLLVLLNILGTCILLAAASVQGRLQDILLLIWAFVGALSTFYEFDLLVNIYVTDGTTLDERTSVSSLVQGSTIFGGIPAFALGGVITRRTGNPFMVYYLALIISAINFLYIAFILPESFSAEKREELKRQQNMESSGDGTEHRLKNFGRIKSAIFAVCRPLALMRPKRCATTGRYKLRLLWCGLHSFIGSLAQGYIETGIVVYLTAIGGYKPDDNGYILTVYSLACVMSLTFLTPLVIKWGRPLFTRRKLRASTNGTLQHDLVDDNGESTASTQFDLNLVVFGWLVDIAAVILVPYVRTREQVFSAIVLLGISVGRAPAFRSVVAASVEPIRSGEALSAVEMLGSVGQAFSGVILGSILSATISTLPSLMFWVYAAIGLVSVSFLFLIRDVERYHPPVSHE